jgi:hypothetical protein
MAHRRHEHPQQAGESADHGRHGFGFEAFLALADGDEHGVVGLGHHGDRHERRDGQAVIAPLRRPHDRGTRHEQAEYPARTPGLQPREARREMRGECGIAHPIRLGDELGR